VTYRRSDRRVDPETERERARLAAMASRNELREREQELARQGAAADKARRAAEAAQRERGSRLVRRLRARWTRDHENLLGIVAGFATLTCAAFVFWTGGGPWRDGGADAADWAGYIVGAVCLGGMGIAAVWAVLGLALIWLGARVFVSTRGGGREVAWYRGLQFGFPDAERFLLADGDPKRTSGRFVVRFVSERAPISIIHGLIGTVRDGRDEITAAESQSEPMAMTMTVSGQAPDLHAVLLRKLTERLLVPVHRAYAIERVDYDPD
jgi:hypothetical protein